MTIKLLTTTGVALLMLGGCTPGKASPTASPQPSEAEPQPQQETEPAPKVTTSPESVSGHLPREVIQKVVRARMASFRACYEEGLKKNPKLAGRVVTRFVIDTSGKVDSAAAIGDFDGDVKQCVAAAAKELTFPPPEGGPVTVAYPIVFSPTGGLADDGPDTGAQSGRLPPEVIQKHVRQNNTVFRDCYVKGLAKDPKLRGRVSVRFVIGTEGRVTSASGTGDIPDKDVITCVTDTVRTIQFPPPEGGIVTVTYPLVFEPDTK